MRIRSVRTVSLLLTLFMGWLILELRIAAQPCAVDLGFAPGSSTDGPVLSTALQRDGKILVGGKFRVAEGGVRGRIARLHSDGSVDRSFGENLAGAEGEVYAIALQEDAKVLIGGNFTNVDGIERNRIARLNVDGSLDASFAAGLLGADREVHSVAVQQDGKVLLGGIFYQVNGVSRGSIARLNTDGSLDLTFNCPLGSYSWIRSIVVQSNGKILIGGSFGSVGGVTRKCVARLNSDGSLDASFGTTSSGADGLVACLSLQSDGKVLVAGAFTKMNGVTRSRLARLNFDGSLDTTFGASVLGSASGPNDTVYALAVQEDGKVVVGGIFSSILYVTHKRIARFNADGSRDSSFAYGLAGSDGAVYSLLLQNDGKIIIGGEFTRVHDKPGNYIARLDSRGSMDDSFSAGFSGINGSIVSALAPQIDGSVLIGGTFTNISGVIRNCIARLKPDGSLDKAFGASMSGANGSVYALALQDDGKVLIAGAFTSVNGVPERNCIARLNPDGSVDGSFGAGLSLVGSDGSPLYVEGIAIQEDGKILLAGCFKSVNGAKRTCLARLNIEGSLDTSFAPIIEGIQIFALALQENGKILIGGNFSQVTGLARNYIARLNIDGSLDRGFAPNVAQAIDAIGLQRDGKILIAGSFINVNGVARKRLARLSADGSLDASFGEGLSGPDVPISCFSIQPDGKVIIGGGFTNVNGVARNRLARLNADGSLDASFGAGLSGSAGNVAALVVRPDGRIFAAGSFKVLNSVARRYVALLYGDRPPLRIARHGDAGLLLSWPVGWTGCSLQQTLSPASWAWSDISVLPSSDGAFFTVALPSTNTGRYYRLRR